MRVFGDIRRILAPFQFEVSAPDRVVRCTVALQAAVAGQAKNAPCRGEAHASLIRRGTAQRRRIGLIRTRPIVGNIKYGNASERTRSGHNLIGRDVDRTIGVADILLAVGYISTWQMRVKFRGSKDKTRGQRSVLVRIKADGDSSARHRTHTKVDVVIGGFGCG